MNQPLTKRQPTKWKNPICKKCGIPIASYLYHKTGHIDQTPIVILRCHFEIAVFGSSPAFADEFRKQMDERFLSGKETMELYADGTYNGPTETPDPSPNPDGSYGTSGGINSRGVKDQTHRGNTDDTYIDYRQFGKLD